jgi:hypothetical protein
MCKRLIYRIKIFSREDGNKQLKEGTLIDTSKSDDEARDKIGKWMNALFLSR